ncbi:MAG TPA: choice-of-anchor P family protein [Candidatus Aquilonibacter sp.]|nr:choice-of-anchor P family protein [Candidatus Aquilonibacter sp.]
MSGGVSKRYHYNAHGHGFSARFDRPVQHAIDIQAASSLPTIGGHGNSRVDDFQFQQFVSFKAAYSHVSGSMNTADGTHTTLATATVEGLNVLDMVTADRVVARLATQHPEDEGEPHVVVLGSRFENLRIAGCPVEVELNHDFFLPLDTFDAIRKELESNANFRKMTVDPFQTGQKQKVPPDPRGVFLCSLVKDMKTSCPGLKRQGHGFIVPQFGKVFVAEMLCKHGRRSLTMLRLEMGSPVSGTAVAGEAIINGDPWPGSH